MHVLYNISAKTAAGIQNATECSPRYCHILSISDSSQLQAQKLQITRFQTVLKLLLKIN